MFKHPFLWSDAQHHHPRTDVGRRDFRDDGISIPSNESHSSGKPISQRHKPGFNTPPLTVSEWDDFVVTPSAIA